MNRSDKQKKKKLSDGFDLDFDMAEEDDDQGDSALDPLFQDYYTPDIPGDEDAPEDETFIEAVEAENEQVLAELEKADQHQRSVMGENKKAVSSGVDTNYYFTVVFVSEEQLKAFFEQSGWDQYGGTRFLNGVLMAQDMGIELPPAYLATEAKPDKSMSKFIRKE